MRSEEAGYFRKVAGVSIVDPGGHCVHGRHFNGRLPSGLSGMSMSFFWGGGLMRGIKIPQQDFVLKTQGGTPSTICADTIIKFAM